MCRVLASAVVRLPTRPATGTVNHVNDLALRDSTAACGKGVKYTPNMCSKAWTTHGSEEVKQKIEREKDRHPKVYCMIPNTDCVLNVCLSSSVDAQLQLTA